MADMESSQIESSPEPPGQDCSLCEELNDEQMVQCDYCDKWYHFVCVNVTSEIANEDWVCRNCAADKSEQGHSANSDNPEAKASKSGGTEVGGNDSSHINTNKSKGLKLRQKLKIDLMRLEEEKQAQMLYLKKKYEIMCEENFSDSDIEGEIGEAMGKGFQWANQFKGIGMGKGKAESVAVRASTEENDGVQNSCIINRAKGMVKGKVENKAGCRSTKSRCEQIGGSQNGDLRGGFQKEVDSGRILGKGEGTCDIVPDTSKNLHASSNNNVSSFSSSSNIFAPSAEQIYSRQVVSRELPVFTGKPEEWPLFISNYENSTRLCGFSEDENLLRLQRALKGKALEYVSNRLTLPSLVPEVIGTLRMVFGRPEHIINGLLSKVRSAPGVNSNKLDTLIHFSLEVKNIAATMEAAGLISHLNNPSLIQELLDKLPTQMRLEWSVFSRSIVDTNLKHLSDWLFNLAEAASRVISTPLTHSGTSESEKRKWHRVGFHGNESNEERERLGCFACGEEHPITACMFFKRKPINEKWNIVHNHMLCRTCLKRHETFHCPERVECQVDGCRAKHHPMLHKPRPVQALTSPSSTVAVHHRQTSTVLYRIVPITIFGKNTSVDVYAFLDDGSGPTLIEEDILSSLQVEGSKSDLCLRWTDGSVRVERNSHNLDLTVAPRGNNYKRFSLRGVRSVAKLDLPAQTIQMDELCKRFKHLKGLPVQSYQDVVPRIIIGLNNRSLAMPLCFREGKNNEPAATKTRLGWTVYGEISAETKENSKSLQVHTQLHVCECDDDVALQTLMLEYMKIENESQERETTNNMTISKTTIENKGIQRDGDRFVVKLLWKQNITTLPDSYGMAYRRLCCFERKLEKDVDLKAQVCKHIQSMEAKGYIQKLTSAEVNEDYKRKWYLPIFAVKNPNKPNKVRVVWDAAAESNGVSLNGCLEKVPDMMTSLVEVLYNFRVGKIAVSGDICEMFHRIAIEESDQQSQRFLWRDGDDKRQAEVYLLKVMSFGACCSPSLAQSVKNLNALEYEDKFPRASKSILKRHYVDDMLDSVDSVQDAIKLAMEVREVHKHANFHIRNWLSNSEEVERALGETGSMNSFCKAGRTVEQVIEADKVLGMWWKTDSDTLTFNLKYTKASQEILTGTRTPTKRQLLRLLMSIFDPLGFLSFFTVFMKTLLQDIWRSGIGWDETIPQEFNEAWNRWRSVLKDVESIHIPRCYFTLNHNKSRKIDVHVFVDASEGAYAAVVYLRTSSEGGVEVSFVCSKSKVAPLKPISIPRMELLAAVMGSRLGNIVTKAHDLNLETTYYWSDSKTVLSWLKTDPKAFKQFVMFRVGEIQENTIIANWRYVPSKQNVADLATKWNHLPDFNPEGRWFKGPAFLLLEPDQWPPNQITNHESTTNESKHFTHQVAVQAEVQQLKVLIDFHRFSKWERLFRSMAYVKRFINCLKARTLNENRIKSKNNNKNMPNLTQEEIIWGQNTLYRLVQAQAYCLEKRLLIENPYSNIPKSSPLKHLSPFLDNNEVIRMRSRLEYSNDIPEATKNPIILPRTHYVTKLIVNYYHRKLHHVNHETLINEMFQKYQILGLRKLVRTIRNECQVCKVRNPILRPPEMAPLPIARLSPYTRAFSHVGLDFFGPFLITIGRRTEKRYGTVFTCLTCRAIHLEVAHSLSMNSCIIVIRNFIARRGNPLRFYSDNGTNLRATEKELKEAHKEINFEGLQAEFTSQNTEWTFIPPGSPHMGGAWERMVRSIKTVLYQIITRDTKITDEKLNNVFLEVESIINSRPLTYLSLETADQEALTPNHFLLGSSSGNKPPGVFDSTDEYVRSSWRHSQFLADKFRKRWVAEFLPTLTRRTNWFEKAKPIEVGDVVIIIDPNLQRHCWPKGVVVRTITAKDGQVRSAIVRTSSGEYHRPATKIAVLDVKANTSDLKDLN